MKTLILFNYDWDAQAYQRIAQQSGKAWADCFAHRGFDLFSFPSNANLIAFDLDRFVNRLAKQAKRQHWTSVTSQNEQFGALAAALLAEKMGWPGTPPAAVAACQHKLYARQVLEQVCPEANTPFARLPAAYGQAPPAGLPYPSFVKPVKAAFSVLAKVIHSQDELHQFTRFGRFELWIIKRLVEPFERVAQRLLPLAGLAGEVGTAHSMLLEKPMNSPTAKQYSLDGYAFAGKLHKIGVVDSIMYPGTQAFMRFDYPSLLLPDIQDRAFDVAQKFLTNVGYTHGLFNMEFFYDAAIDKLTVIEFNPRLASQFADLYLQVKGVDLHAYALALAQGRDPALLKRVSPTANCATSAVYRVFDSAAPHLPQSLPHMPTPAQLQILQQRYPDHVLISLPKTATASQRDFKWLGSYRYGILHLGGHNDQDLFEQITHASQLLGWPVPYADTVMASTPIITDSPNPPRTLTSITTTGDFRHENPQTAIQ